MAEYVNKQQKTPSFAFANKDVYKRVTTLIQELSHDISPQPVRSFEDTVAI